MDAVPRELARRARARHVRARAGGSRLASRGGRAGQGRALPGRSCARRGGGRAARGADDGRDRRHRRVALPAAARVACRSLDALLGIVSAARDGRPSAPLIAALATRVAHDPAIADADTALAAASSLRRLATAPGALDDSAVAGALRAAAPRRRSRRGWYAAELGETAGRHALPFSAVAPAAVAAAALASRRDFWDFLEDAGVETGRPRRRSRRRSPPPPRAPRAAPLRRRRRRHGRRGGAGVETGGVPPGAVSPRGAPRARHRRVRRGGGVSGSGRAISRRVGGVRGGVSRARRRRARPSRARRLRRLATRGRGVGARGRGARRVRARARARRRGRRLRARRRRRRPRRRRRCSGRGAGSTARPRRPRRRGAPRCSAPARRRRSASTSAWADAGVANRGLAAVANAFGDSGLGAVSGVGNGWVGFGSTEREWTRAGPAHAWRAAERLAVSGETPEMRAEDAEALARSALMTVALVAPPSTRREQVVSSILAASSGPIRHAENAPPPLVACAGAGAATPPPRRRRRPRGARCAPSWSAPRRARRRRALDETRDLLGGDEWTRCVGRHLSLGVGATPAKACLAAALARTPSGRAALGESGAAARSRRRSWSSRRRRAPPPPRGVGARGLRRGGAGAEDDAADDAADCSFRRASARGSRMSGSASVAAATRTRKTPRRRLRGSRLSGGARATPRSSPRRCARSSSSSRRRFSIRAARTGREGRGGGEAGGGVRRRARPERDPPSRLSVAARDGGVASSGARRDARRARLGGGRREPGRRRDRGFDPVLVAPGVRVRGRGRLRAARAARGARRRRAPRGAPRTQRRIRFEFRPRIGLRAPGRAPGRVLRPRGRHAPAGARRAPRRAVPSLLARAPPGGEAAAESRGDFLRSAPAPTIRLGAGVTRRALRATLRWAYSGALPFPADVSDGLFLSRDGGDGEAADEGSARNALAKLASKCGAYELAHTTRFRRPKPGARVRRLTEALDALMTSGEGYADVLLRAETNAAGPDDRLDERSSRRFPAHRVVLCARAEYFRAALDPARGFLESRPLKARDADARREDAMPVVGVPVRGDGGGARRGAPRGVRGRGAAGGRRRAREKKEKTFAFGATYDDIDTENVSATTAVHLAASLEYLMLDREAEACASRVAHARARATGASGWAVSPARWRLSPPPRPRADGPSSRRCWARSRRSTPRRPRPSPRRSRRSTPTYGRRCGARTSSKREPGDDETRAPGCVYL